MSSDLLPDTDLIDYINNFVIYDFAANFQLDELKTTFSFYTKPNVDTYSINTTDVTSSLYNFNNIYMQVYSPVFIQGYTGSLLKSAAIFNELFCLDTPYIYEVGTGNGLTANYTGTIDHIPILKNSFKVNALDVNDNGLEAHDDGAGNIEGDVVAGGYVDYLTGVFDITFNTNVKNLEEIKAYYTTYVANRPTTILYAQNEFKVRPVPDRPYKIELSVTKRPSELLLNDDCPTLGQWWKYIAYGVSIDVLEDKRRFEESLKLERKLKEQESLIRLKSIRNNSDRDLDELPTNKKSFINWSKG